MQPILNVSNIEKYYGVNLHGDIILGDHWLGVEVYHLLLQGDFFGHPVHKGDGEVDAGLPSGLISAHPLHNEHGGLGDNFDVEHYHDH